MDEIVIPKIKDLLSQLHEKGLTQNQVLKEQSGLSVTFVTFYACSKRVVLIQ